MENAEGLFPAALNPLSAQSLDHLRHDLRTPVINVLGYSELLIEDAGDRHLEALVPVFQQIHGGGRQLLEAIQDALSQKRGPGPQIDLDEFRQNLRAQAAQVLETSTELLVNLENIHRETFADLNAICRALRRLMAFSGEEKGSVAQKRSHTPNVAGAALSKPAGKILIADDDAANRDLLRRRLEFEGHQVLEAKNGLEVLALLKDQACDLVLLDIVMPEMDGFQTLAQLKQEPQLRELPVIMISALDELRSAVRCIEMGAEDYLPKPFNRVLLRARIGASLEKKRLRDHERRKAGELEETLRLLEQAQAQLAVQASQDPLTGLANRRSIDSHLESRAQRASPFTVIYIDLNHFKTINDSYGHQAGDELLRQVGDRLRLAFRSTDFVGRWGGDEFVALVEASLGDPEAHNSRIAEVFSKEFVIQSHEVEERVTIGASVGVASWIPGETVAEVIHRADAEMYQQKLRIAP